MNGKLRHRLQGAAAMLVVLAVVLGGMSALAANETKTISAQYSGIKIYVDGAEITPKDANGNVIEPFIYNGTTYLPVRAVAQAFGKDVVWDGASQSVFLGKKDQNQPDEWLDRIQHSYYSSGYDEDNLFIINGKITDYGNVDYSNGILLYRGYSGGFDVTIDYPLNMNYKTLTGKVVLPKSIDIAGLNKPDALGGDAQIDKIEIYGDGVLLKTIPKISISMNMTFEVNVTGVLSLSIKIFRDKDWSSYYVALTDLALYK